MTRIIPLAALLLSASLLSACSGYELDRPFGGGYGGGGYGPPPPPPPPPPPMMEPGTYRGSGTEPFWSLDLNPQTMRFSQPEGQPVIVATPPVINGVAGETYRTPRLTVNIVHGRCSDGMSDRTYPDRVQVTADGQRFEGCGWLDEGFSGPPPPGVPPPQATPLVDSRWRVIAINGRPTPAGDRYRMDFTGDRLAAGFGCNGLGGNYVLDRDMISVAGLIGTQMACSELAMAFESQGSAILRIPARVRFAPGRLTLTNNAGVIELERR